MSHATKLIELENGIFVEIDSPEDDVSQVSSRAAEKVEENLDKVKSLLLNVSKPVIGAWSELSDSIVIEQAEVEVGLSFEGEGNLYITKAKAGANITVKLVIRPKSEK